MRILYKYLIAIIISSYLFCAIGCGSDIEHEIYYIPEKYIGGFYIVFRQKNGVQAEFEGDARIYRIPESGILLSQFGTNAGIVKNKSYRQYFYISKLGQITDSLPSLYLESAEEISKMDYIGVAFVNYIGTTIDGEDIQYSYLIIDTLSKIEQKYSEQTNHYEIIKDALQNK